jgi:hypothetical protein
MSERPNGSGWDRLIAELRMNRPIIIYVIVVLVVGIACGTIPGDCGSGDNGSGVAWP